MLYDPTQTNTNRIYTFTVMQGKRRRISEEHSGVGGMNRNKGSIQSNGPNDENTEKCLIEPNKARIK